MSDRTLLIRIYRPRFAAELLPLPLPFWYIGPVLITFPCRKCGVRLEIEAVRAGERIACPACGAALDVPAAAVGPGATVGGFRIEKQIGEGGMGRVFLARQLSMDRPVALKILPAAMAADATISDRFVQEVRLAARLDHPGLVAAYEAGQDHGVLYFAMAYVPGQTLHERLRAEGPMTETAALRVALKLAHALAYAWSEHRMLHRDIKPANILLDPRGEPRLTDLGLAQTLDAQTDGPPRAGSIVGTPNYMSPEAASGRPLDPRSDLYSFGATLWSMLTAQIPFEGEPVGVILKKQLTEPYPDVRRWNPAVSTRTLALLDRLLAKPPEKRFRSWEELIPALEDALIRRPPAASRPRPFALLLLVAFCLLLAISLAALWALLRARAPHAPPRPIEAPAVPG